MRGKGQVISCQDASWNWGACFLFVIQLLLLSQLSSVHASLALQSKEVHSFL